MAVETTLTSAKGWHPDIKAFAPTDVVGEALIFQASTVLGTVDGDEPVCRVPYVGDEDETNDADFVNEGDPIAESDLPLNEITVRTKKIAKLVPVSNEQWGQEGVAGNLSQAVSDFIVRKANRAFLTQPAPVGPYDPPVGLLNHPGITEMPTVVGANLDPLVDLIATLESLGSHPSHVILSPLGWASLSKIKTKTDSAETLLGSGLNAGERRLQGLPVIVSEFLAGKTGVVIDKRAVVSVAGDVKVMRSEHYYFNRDSLALRATFRFGWNIVRPYRVGKFTVA